MDPLDATKQLYLPDTNILITRFLAPQGMSEIHDFMPVGAGPRRLIRSVVAVRGVVRFRLDVEARFGYGRNEPQVTLEPGGATFRAPGHALALGSQAPLAATAAGATGEFTLAAAESRTFVLESGDEAEQLSAAEARRLGVETLKFWRDWLGQSSYRGRWREMVHRSALTLKLLSDDECLARAGRVEEAQLAFEKDVQLREPPRALLRTSGPRRRAVAQLSPGLHPSRFDQRGVRTRPGVVN